MKNKIVIGIDQSYQDTGITVAMNGIVKMSRSIELHSLNDNSTRRLVLRKELNKIINKLNYEIAPYCNASIIVLIERIRLQSQGFVNIDYIKSIGALNALIVDVAHSYNLQCFSVDTRAWKSTIIGTSKTQSNSYGIDPHKWPTILWCIKHGYKKYIKYPIENNKKKKGVIEKNGERYSYNDNIADSIGICLYGFTNNPKLKEEH